jgi:hypothetical protein
MCAEGSGLRDCVREPQARIGARVVAAFGPFTLNISELKFLRPLIHADCCGSFNTAKVRSDNMILRYLWNSW